MAVQKLEIQQFIEYAQRYPVLDVRSPGEYIHAHIPGAISFPLFTDQERKVVGTLYKQRSRQDAIKQGLDFFAPKMRPMVEQVESILAGRQSPATNASEVGDHSNTILVHCWRGGMRSGAVAWLLDLYGFNVCSLIGGYKKYRNFVLQELEKPYPFKILGGYTGSGKTFLLNELKRAGKITIDLEGIANHKGSAFGALGQPAQPSQEMFENLLASELIMAMNALGRKSIDAHTEPVWIEDESMRIGSVNIPQPIWNQMRQAQVLFLDIPFEKRLDFLVEQYGSLNTESMINAIIRISKRLGGLETKTAINYLLEGNKKASFEGLLHYYDKQYLKGLNSRPDPDLQVIPLEAPTVDARVNAARLLNKNQSITYSNDTIGN
ncbi:MAG TPA: tRNA 2-selenouridine(34) synthase MnmH [Flavitalea sp.]|nr:tRNA 2-selenouridine(34) synthase MnmH [Flavitalea sp.]